MILDHLLTAAAVVIATIGVVLGTALLTYLLTIPARLLDRL